MGLGGSFIKGEMICWDCEVERLSREINEDKKNDDRF